jgi:3-isopropylmalate/(R)-2-methylmalate dehydratase large subunit
MSRKTLFDTVWDEHKVRSLPRSQAQILIGRHLIHEVTSPQAFPMIEERGLSVRFPKSTFATVDHIVPTVGRNRPLLDPIAEIMLQHLEQNTAKHKITLFNLSDENQGIVHIIGPELGITQPGMTIACGDSHTSTHGAFGAIALGIGTTQIACVLSTGCLLLERPKVRKIQVDGVLGEGVTAKDITLAIINRLGVKGGIGYAYEYAGSAIHALDMEGRMTICNMSIEGGAQCGYVNPDQITVEYLRGRKYVPKGNDFDIAVKRWLSLASGPEAEYDDVFVLPASEIQPMMTYGITPGQSIGVSGTIPLDAPQDALDYMQLEAGKPLLGTKVDVAFIGSCTNGRISDLREAANLIKKYGLKVASHVTALAVPGSENVRRQAEGEGLDRVFTEAGWQWRGAGCSMCLAMNPDKLQGNQLCASSSNRNFKGRQGSPTGRTVLMSPASVVACATAGQIADVRKLTSTN